MVLVLLEALTVIVVGGVFLSELGSSHHDTSTGPLIFLGVLAIAVGVGLAAVARGLRFERRWARGPALTWQIVTLPIGARFVQFGLWWIAVPVLGVALAALVLLISLAARPEADPTEPG